ncbi:ets DNA-binding protein pokkuri [Daktulosphaira vitifoliae]|uniref:ets DNA-binding protein pokkuri n=1 Tax=Daktulosphaira vitifoliae TaxID=58002 RepID=UPI0021AA05BD|nr:ets DNA-binding protein pokkuri [Daktulosphaira vitifoliae]XP_050524893.1 ets DNA-binding protein pokkuri [Daktulosphaira vitifoliae]
MKLMPFTPGQVSSLTRPGGGGAGSATNGGTAGLNNNAAAAAFVFNSNAVAAADLFWRYHHPHHGGAFNFPPSPTLLPPTPFPSPLDFKHHLPANLITDPRIWSKEDVAAFIQWAELEFDLPRFDTELFQMNGKALCLLTKQDLGERCPGAGDLLYNVLQLLRRGGDILSASSAGHLPSSPVASHFPFSPTWCLPPQPSSPAVLSPAPSIDSQSDSPRHMDHQQTPTSVGHHLTPSVSIFPTNPTVGYSNNGTSSGGSNQSDSDPEDSSNGNGQLNLPPPTPTTPSSSTSPPPYSPSTPKQSNGNIFFPSGDSNSIEPNTNGRLLWDFLQQLLNDSQQRFTSFIAWKNQEMGVFKIVDPPGLAKLWGIQKNHLSMNYDKMSRALRYYYRVNILRKVQGERHCYQFLRNPSELKCIKNISLLRQQMASSSPQTLPTPTPAKQDIGTEVSDDEYKPTDLSMSCSQSQWQDGPQDLSTASNSSSMQLQLNMSTSVSPQVSSGLSKTAIKLEQAS